MTDALLDPANTRPDAVAPTETLSAPDLSAPKITTFRKVPANEVPVRLYDEGERGQGRAQRKVEVRATLNRVEVLMIRRIQAHYDVPFSMLVRLLIREKYNDLYGDQSPEIEVNE